MPDATPGSAVVPVNAPGSSIPYCGCIRRIRASTLDKASVSNTHYLIVINKTVKLTVYSKRR